MDLDSLIMEEMDNCPTCSEADACLIRPVMLYAREVGLENFKWQMKNDLLPVEVSCRLELLLKNLDIIIVSF